MSTPHTHAKLTRLHLRLVRERLDDGMRDDGRLDWQEFTAVVEAVEITDDYAEAVETAEDYAMASTRSTDPRYLRTLANRHLAAIVALPTPDDEWNPTPPAVSAKAA